MGKIAKNKTLMFFILMLGMVVTSMTTTAISNALPVIMTDMQISAGTAQWLTSGFTLAAGIMIPATAFLMRRYTNKTLFLCAMLLYGAGSLIAAIAPGFVPLLLGRILQGCGCGILMSFVQVVILAMYPKEKHGTIMGIYGLGCTAAPVVAPTIFGVIIDMFGWHIMFVIFTVLALIDIILCLVFMNNVTDTEEVSFDMLSMLLSAIGFGGLLIGLGNLSAYPLFHIMSGVPILFGVICLFVFSVKQLKGQKKLVDIRVFRHRTFTTAVILNILLYFVIMGNSTLLPLFIQDLRGFTATDYALITLPSSIASAVFTLLSGPLYDKYGGKILFNTGMILMAGGCAMRFVSSGTTSIFNMGMAAFVLSIGTACIMMPASTMGLSGLDESERVHGSAILATLRQIAGAVGSALGVAIMSMAALRYTSLGEIESGFKGISISYMSLFVICIIGLIVALTCVKKKVD